MPNANGFTDIPAFTQADMTNPAGFVRKLEQLREQVQLVIGTRGPGRGNPAWIDQLIDIGVVDDGGRGPRLPPRQPPGSDDKSPPPMPAGLTVTPGINHIFVEITAPTYAQGGGNAYSTIYAATRDPASTDPLPTFGNATAVVTVPYGTEIHAIPTEPNVQWHVWVTHTTYADVEGPPAGGTNGASCVSGRLVGYEHFEALSITNALIANLAVDNAKIANLSASKITAGSLAVGSYIQSSGFVSGFQGFRISGDGNAEFNNAIFRGVVYADGGEIGGAIIDATGVESDNYVFGSTGWRLDNATGTLYAYSVVLPAGVATVASAANTGEEVDWLASGTAGEQTLDPVDVVTLETTGAPCYVSGWLQIAVGDADADIWSIRLLMQVKVGLITLQQCEVRVRTCFDSTADFAFVQTVLPIAGRFNPPAGIHTVQVILKVQCYDSGGFPKDPGTQPAFVKRTAYAMIQENKL